MTLTKKAKRKNSQRTAPKVKLTFGLKHCLQEAMEEATSTEFPEFYDDAASGLEAA